MLHDLAQEIMDQCKEEAEKKNKALKATVEPPPRKLDVVTDDYIDDDYPDENIGDIKDDDDDVDDSALVHHYDMMNRETEILPSEWFEPYVSADERKKKWKGLHFIRWKTLYSGHPFIKAWRMLQRQSRYYRHLMAIKRNAVAFDGALPNLGMVHPKYVIMTRNGRTYSYSPNIQLAPVSPGFREMFVSPPGSVFVTLDYSCIELCTLAAVCKNRYGFSKLADVINSGVDPHSFTASMLYGRTFDEFMSLRTSSDENERTQFQVWRQKAKAINFGIPGGLGAASLRDYAQFGFGVEMSLSEASELRQKFITEVYPELGLYLQNDPMAILAANTCNGYEMTWDALWKGERTEHIAIIIRQIIRGKIVRRNGEPYKDSFVQSIWAGLRELCGNSAVNPVIANLVRKLSVTVARNEYTEETLKDHAKLVALLFNTETVTLCGRIRGLFCFFFGCLQHQMTDLLVLLLI